MKLDDIHTVYWKERREWVASQRQNKSGWVAPLVLVAVVGGFLPYQLKTLWTTSMVSILVAMWVIFFRVTNTIADSIAGERERHTLEALMITPLPAYAIVWGKMLAAVRNTGPVMLLAMVVALGTSNGRTLLAHWHMYSLPVLIGILLDGGLAGLVAAAVGIWISVHSRTVRQAQQTLSVLSLLFLIIPTLINNTVHLPLMSVLATHDLSRTIAALSLGLILAGGILVVIAQRSFQAHP